MSSIPIGADELTEIVRSNVPWWQLVSARNRFNIVNFVETGTADGKTSAVAARMFQNVWTVEPHPGCYENAKKRLARFGNVHQILGTSPQALYEIAPKLQGPTLYYLDGHWTGAGPKFGIECPVMGELDFLVGRDDTFILVDDARMFTPAISDVMDTNQWPTMDQIAELVRRKSNWPIFHFFDVLWIVPEPLSTVIW